jgi:hypothetical protein
MWTDILRSICNGCSIRAMLVQRSAAVNNARFSYSIGSLRGSFNFSTATGTSKWVNVHILRDLANHRPVGPRTRAVRHEAVEVPQ